MNQCMQESNLSHFDLHMFDATSASLASATTSTRKIDLKKQYNPEEWLSNAQ